MPDESLKRYRAKRDFGRTPEPSGDPGSAGAAAPPPVGGRRFVVQRHRATRLHYDFRLEVDGVLVSWAVPKGPSLDPASKRAAFHVEDHPIDYFDFEGTIPKGEYGGGDVIVWDWGTYEPEATDDPGKSLRDGELKFSLRGEKLNGRFTIVKTKGWDGPGSRRSDQEAWLLIKKRDDMAVDGWDAESHLKSVKTGRTNDEVAAGDRPKTAPRSVPAVAQAATSASASSRMPAFIEPMTATLAEHAFDDQDWLFEVKWDGYRVQAHVRDGQTSLYTRRGLNAAEYFPELAGPPSWLDANEAIVDGEVVALNAAGESDFGLLQARGRNRRARSASAVIDYVVFDLLYLDGVSLLGQPLEDRKRLLRSVVRDGAHVHFASHVVGDGLAFYDAVAARGLEGIVAKRRRSRYEPGRRSKEWLKVKRHSEQEFVVGGWTTRQGSDSDLGALMVGTFEDGHLRPVGKVGTGFDARERTRLVELLTPLAQSAAPFQPVPTEAGARWVSPELVVRIEFAEWTSDGNLRAPSYRGLELDADPASVLRERPEPVAVARPVVAARGSVEPDPDPPSHRRGAPAVEGSGALSAAELAALDALPPSGGQWTLGDRTLKLSNLGKVLWPADGITKRDLIRYHAQIAPYLLPYLRDRALTLQRYPDGVATKGFWQKQVPSHAPDWLGRWPWKSTSTGESIDYLLADSAATLVWVANEAAIDIHPSTFKVERPDRPTWALVDVDPGSRTSWDELLLLTRLYRTALDHLGLRGFPKLTGQRGIQVWIPVKPTYTFDQTRDWVADLSHQIAAAAPELVSWKWEKAQRDGLARLDYTQNAWNKTLVAPYSVRPVAGAPVSAPIRWDELDHPDLRPNSWTIRTALGRLADVGDLFERAIGLEQELPAL